MKALGKISIVSRGGDLLLRGGEVPALYSLAGTKSAKIGKINDVIGPVSNPYIVVRPGRKLTEDEISSLREETFYEYRRKEVGKKSRVH